MFEQSSELYEEYEHNNDFIFSYNENENFGHFNKIFKWGQALSLDENESLFGQEYQRNDFDINNSILEKEDMNNENKKTQVTTLTKTKKDLNKIQQSEDKKRYSLNLLQQNNEDNENKINIEKKTEMKKNNKGRYKKDEISNNEKKHDKKAEDNLMRKIKTNIFLYISTILNNSLKDKRNKFFKLDKGLNENLKKDYNEDLMKKTIGEIYQTFDISLRFKKTGQNLNNKNLVKKIYEEGEEKNTINILNMKYIDVVNNIRKNYLDEFLQKINKKEKKNNGMNDEEYIVLLKDLFNRYEQWFNEKKGRNRKK